MDFKLPMYYSGLVSFTNLFMTFLSIFKIKLKPNLSLFLLYKNKHFLFLSHLSELFEKSFKKTFSPKKKFEIVFSKKNSSSSIFRA